MIEWREVQEDGRNIGDLDGNGRKREWGERRGEEDYREWEHYKTFIKV